MLTLKHDNWYSREKEGQKTKIWVLLILCQLDCLLKKIQNELTTTLYLFPNLSDCITLVKLYNRHTKCYKVKLKAYTTEKIEKERKKKNHMRKK